ncbi:RNA polymerase sigma factor [Actinoplanes sp. NBRC 103695]|uniref:RNA polymerase sigma factor n=1 Tax=Actinoplanes sp. NBRC 103695 TaxID=3032202 RepID=UPI0024A4767E|nr:RNA polymerase sigma factor [Actinoplanes sp. NBRC 103695]GLZ02299.1 siderophore-interacting protein [Actinoplanes sp. NBRC 103695]
MDPPTDAQLLRSAIDGRSESFGVVFERHADAVYNHCFRRLGSWSAAEDATSLVFLETWRTRAKAVDVDGRLLPWLLGVANNVVRNVSRTARRYDAAVLRLPPPAHEPDPADRIAARLDDERRMQPLLHQLAGLRRAEQDVVALVLMSGLTYAEAAVALGVPVGTVRSRLARARKRLGVTDTTTKEEFADVRSE